MKDYTLAQVEEIAWDREQSKKMLLDANMADWLREFAAQIVRWETPGPDRQRNWKRSWRKASLARARAESARLFIERHRGLWEGGRVWLNIENTQDEGQPEKGASHVE